jgi:hypothetical protein
MADRDDEVFLDEDSGLPTILDDNGHRRPLGFIPQTDIALMESVPTYQDTASLIPESEWVEFDEWPSEIKIKDQDGKGACNGHAAAISIEVARYVAGMPYVPISAWYIYAILCNGVDRGSMILDALKLCEDDGAAPESLVQYGIINPRKLTAEAHAAAPRFKAEIGSRVTTYQEIGTALQRRQSLNVAVCVGSGFNRLSSDGVPGLSRGACNHAVGMALGMKKSSSGEWLGRMPNSWTTQWGDKGFCWLPLKYIPTAAYFEAYTIRAVADDSADTTRPPVIV